MPQITEPSKKLCQSTFREDSEEFRTPKAPSTNKTFISLSPEGTSLLNKGGDPGNPVDIGDKSSWVQIAERMRILMVDKATPLVLNGSEIIGSAWEALGGEKMVQVDYVKITIRETVIPVPVLVPATFFGGEIANVQKYVAAQIEALSLIIEEKARLLYIEKDHLPSYLQLEEVNLERAKELCRQQLSAAQCFVACKKAKTHENMDWIRHFVSDSIRNQYKNWKLMGEEQTERISVFLRQITMPASASDFTQNVNNALRNRANEIFRVVLQDEVYKRISEVGQDTYSQWSDWTNEIKYKAFQYMDFEMISFTRDYINSLLHTAKESIEPHIQSQVVQTVMLQTSMLLTFMKARINQFMETAHSSQDIATFARRVRENPLFVPTEEKADE